VAELEARLRKDELSSETARIPDKETLRNLAQDLATIWNLPSTDMRLKQRIVRILVAEIVADVDQENQQIILLIHWTGGQHSELRIKKNATGKHSRCTSLEAIEIIRRMAGRFPDDQIAATLNRLSLRTGMGNTWREGNVRTVRSYHELPGFTALQCDRSTLTMEEASTRLAVSHKIVRRLIEAGKITATQVVPCAPWEISAEAIESQAVLTERGHYGQHLSRIYRCLRRYEPTWPQSAPVGPNPAHAIAFIFNHVARRCRMLQDRSRRRSGCSCGRRWPVE